MAAWHVDQSYITMKMHYWHIYMSRTYLWENREFTLIPCSLSSILVVSIELSGHALLVISMTKLWSFLATLRLLFFFFFVNSLLWSHQTMISLNSIKYVKYEYIFINGCYFASSSTYTRNLICHWAQLKTDQTPAQTQIRVSPSSYRFGLSA